MAATPQDMAEHCERCSSDLDNGQIGKCGACQDATRKGVMELHLTLMTAGGCTGTQCLTQADSKMDWDKPLEDADGYNQTVLASFSLEKDGEVIDSFEMDGHAWQQLESEGDMAEVLRDCLSSGQIESSLRSQLDVYENHYEHKKCGTTWTDTWSCGCDDECPTCGADISPHESIMLSGLNDDVPARYVVKRS